MGHPTYLFGLYQQDENELVRKINQISRGLQRLSQLIAHGQSMKPEEHQDLQTFVHEVKQKIEEATQKIKAIEPDVDRESLGLQVDAFHQDALWVLERLNTLKTLPNLEKEQLACDQFIQQFEAFEKELPEGNIPRADVLEALHEASALLGEINTTIRETLNNLLIPIARCTTGVANVLKQVDTGPELKI